MRWMAMNKEFSMKKTLVLAIGSAAVLAVLAACGGGDDDHTPPATTSVPAGASASVGGWINYLKALVASNADTLEPVDVSNVTPPADDSGEPAVVD
jgi:hypothetical protein